MQLGDVNQRAFLKNMQDWSCVDVRRWVVGGVTIQVVGYLTILVVGVLAFGWDPLITPRLLVAAGSCGVALGLALRGHYQTASLLALSVTWLEIQVGFLTKAEAIGPGLAVLPVLVMGVCILTGSRAGLVVALVTILASVLSHRLNPFVRESGFTPQLVYWLAMHAIGVMAGWTIMTLSLEGFSRVFTQLRARQQDLADTIRFAPDGMLVVDAAQAIIIANPAAEAILRMPAERIVGRTYTAVLAEASGQPEDPAALPADTGETPIALQWVSRDGTALHVEATWRGMEGGRREVLLRDVSVRRRLEQERQAMEAQVAEARRLEAVGQLAGGLSHDFNNILTAIGGLAELLRAEADPTVRAALADEMAAARERGAALTRQLLAFANRDVVQPRVLDLAAFVTALEPRLRAQLGAEHSLVIMTTPGCWVRADEAQIAQAIESLVANAQDAMRTAGRCTITVDHYTGVVGVPQVRLRVADTGAGMAPGVAERAFEPFFTTKARGHGRGLGLTIVHALVTQSGGISRIRSEKGSGTSVEMDLPLVAAPARQTPTSSAPVVVTTGRTILLAEDDDGTRSTVARLLRRSGYTVIEARDGTEGLHLAMTTREPIHLLLTDVMMPGLTGPALADRVRDVDGSIPVLFMTGYAEQDVAAHLSAGRAGRALIAKPFAPDALLTRVEALMRAGQSEDALTS